MDIITFWRAVKDGRLCWR